MRHDFINNFAIIETFIELQHDLLWGKIPPPLQECELLIDPTVTGLRIMPSTFCNFKIQYLIKHFCITNGI